MGSPACDQEPQPCLASAPLSRAVYHDKLELLGEWEHKALLVESPFEEWAVDVPTQPRLISWAVGEDYLWALEDGEPVATFAIDSHVTTGFLPSGYECVVTDERPWYERRHARIAWSDDLARADVLPLGAEVTEVEEAGLLGDDFLDDDGQVYPGFHRDGEGRLVVITTRARYLVECPACDATTILVTHRFERLD